MGFASELGNAIPTQTATAKNVALAETLANVEKIETLKKTFAKSSNEYYNWLVESLATIDMRFAKIDGTAVGNTEESVTTYRGLLDTDDANYIAKSKEFMTTLDALSSDLEGCGVPQEEDNEYTYWSNKGDNDVSKFEPMLDEAIDRRRKAFDKEAEAIQQGDAKEREMADIAKEFIDYCTHMRMIIDEPKGTPQEVYDQVKAEWDERKPLEEKYKKVEELDAELKEIGTKTNKYSPITLTDVKTVHKEPTIAYVEGYQLQFEEDGALLDGLKFDAEKFVKWIREHIGPFEVYEFTGVLSTTMEAYSKFREFRSEEKPPQEKVFRNLLATRDAVNQSNEQHNRPPFEPEAESYEAVFEPEWEVFEEYVLDYEDDLREEISRLLILENMVQHFYHEVEEMSEWVVENAQKISGSSDLKRRGQTRSAIASMAMFDAEYVDRTKDMQETKELGEKIMGEGYYDASEVAKQWDALRGPWRALKDTDEGESQALPDATPKDLKHDKTK